MAKKVLLTLFSLLLLLSCGAEKNKSSHYVFLNKKAEQKYIAAYNQTLKLWPVPFQEKDIQTTFGTAHVIVSGPESGEVLVLFHGMDASSTMWYPNIAEYTKKYKVYAIDFLMEAGKSVSNGKNLGSKEIISWYDQIFDALKLKNINLVGVSRGGWIATHYTLNSKKRVKKLVLLAPVQTFENINIEYGTRSTATFKFFPSRKGLTKVVNHLSQKPEKIASAFKEQMYLGIKYTHSSSSLDLLQMKPFSDKELQSLTLPVMVLSGDHDILNDPAIIEKAGKLLPDVYAAIIKDAGHFLTIDQNEEVDEKIMEFLKEKEIAKGNPAKPHKP